MDNMSLVENLIVFPLMGVGALTIICLAVGGAGLCIWKWCAKRAELNALFERHREIESAQRIVVDCGDQCIKRQTKDIVRKVVDEVEKEIIKMLEEKIGAQEM